MLPYLNLKSKSLYYNLALYYKMKCMIKDSNIGIAFHLRYTNSDTNKLIEFCDFLTSVDSNIKNLIVGLEGRASGHELQKEVNTHIHAHFRSKVKDTTFRNKIRRSKFYTPKCFSIQPIRSIASKNISYVLKFSRLFYTKNLNKKVYNQQYLKDAMIKGYTLYELKINKPPKNAKLDKLRAFLLNSDTDYKTIEQVASAIIDYSKKQNWNIGNANSQASTIRHFCIELNIIKLDKYISHIVDLVYL